MHLQLILPNIRIRTGPPTQTLPSNSFFVSCPFSNVIILVKAKLGSRSGRPMVFEETLRYGANDYITPSNPSYRAPERHNHPRPRFWRRLDPRLEHFSNHRIWCHKYSFSSWASVLQTVTKVSLFPAPVLRYLVRSSQCQPIRAPAMNTNPVDVERSEEHLPRGQGSTSGLLHLAYFLDLLKNTRVLTRLGTHVAWQRPFMVWIFDKLSRMIVAYRQDNLGRHPHGRVHTNCDPRRETSE